MVEESAPRGEALREGRDFVRQADWARRQTPRRERQATLRPLLHALVADPGFREAEPARVAEEPAWWTELALAWQEAQR